MNQQLLLILLLSCTVLGCFHPSNSSSNPPESEPVSDLDDPKRDSLKQVYLDQLYYATEGTNVDSIRHENWKNNYRIKQEKRQQAQFRTNTSSFANGKIEGAWYERGPDNEAGDMREIAYMPATDELYGLSSVGHLWKGTLAGNDWVLLNDDIQFEADVIQALPHNGGTRIFAIYGTGVDDKIIRYSDDNGLSWTKGTGFDFYDHWGAGRRLFTMSDNNTLYYLVHTWSGSPWGQLMQLYKSTNKGVTWTQVIETPVGYSNATVDVWQPYGSDNLFWIDNVAKEYIEITHDFATGNTNLSTPVSYAAANIANGLIHVSGRYNASNSNYDFYIATGTNSVYHTNDGANWTYLSTIPDNIWRKGWLADPSNDKLYAGGFQLKQTSDFTNWTDLYAQWWVYYSTSKDMMHVDMMNFQYFETAGGTPFIIVCNHAGVFITYDSFNSTTNLGLNNLNVTTLYDQTTASDGFLYCGAQDKGTFTYNGNSMANFDQLSTDNRSTGDGMIGVFFNADNSMAMMLQNGSFFAYADKATSNYNHWGSVPGNNKPGWINPIAATPDFFDNTVYIAGGNLNGGNGSYLIKMDMTVSSSVSFSASQFNYDFRANSNTGGGIIKAIGTAMSDYDRIYVATSDATFFTSTDAGATWTKSSAILPSSMIPWEIVTSNTVANKVFVSGTGMSNTGVYQSNDGGATFTPLSGGIPAATFYEIALSDDDGVLFASTSEGPYAYVFEDAQWYSLMDVNTPIVDYNTVDNIGNNIIRFGTYGRGVWDFQITALFLPAELTKFDAKLNTKNQVQTSWTTASEANVDHFEIQHSTNGLDFTTIGKVAAKGNSQTSNDYAFMHLRPSNGINYYRLKINDLDGKFDYSAVESVSVNGDNFEFTIYPNPLMANGELTIKTGFDAPYSLAVSDASGRVVMQRDNLTGTTVLPTSFPAGIYMYRIDAGEKVLSGRLVVSK